MGALQQITAKDIMRHCRGTPDPEWEEKHKNTVKRLKSCVGKKAFVSESIALSALSDKNNYEIYKCSYCAFWHIGHKKGKKKRIKVL